MDLSLFPEVNRAVACSILCLLAKLNEIHILHDFQAKGVAGGVNFSSFLDFFKKKETPRIYKGKNEKVVF